MYDGRLPTKTSLAMRKASKVGATLAEVGCNVGDVVGAAVGLSEGLTVVGANVGGEVCLEGLAEGVSVEGATVIGVTSIVCSSFGAHAHPQPHS